MKICVFQMSADIAPEDRLARIEAAMDEAAGAGADLLIAPELALGGYASGAALRDAAQTAGGVWAQALQAAAKRLGISVVAGFPERDGDTCYISAMVIDHTAPAQALIYRKGCLYGDYERGIFVSNGPTTVTCEMQGLTLGFLICYDVEFPENTRRLARAGVDLIVVPTALPTSASARFVAEHGVRVRAFENLVFLAYADNADSDQGKDFQGLSSIVAPDGSVLAAAPVAGDAMLYATLDPRAYDDLRAELPYLDEAPVTA